MAEDAKPVIVCLTASGLETARQAATTLDAELHGLAHRVDAAITFENTVAHLRTLFREGRPIIGVCAAGVLIRALAPLLDDKMTEPPVLALAQDGSAIVPLLGGHRGANALALTLEEAVSGDAAITTASDVALRVALDAPPPGWAPACDWGAIEACVAGLLSGADARIEGAPAPWLLTPLRESLGDALDLSGVDETALQTRLFVDGCAAPAVYAAKRLLLGVGAARGADPEAAVALAERVLDAAGAPASAVAAVVSLDLKADEAAVHAVAEAFGASARFFDAQTLERQTPRLANPSETVFAEVGCHGVAEAAALAAAGPEGRLLVPKRKSAEATAALALAPAPLATPPGRRRGRLSIVGLGPGGARAITSTVRSAIATAEAVVGFKAYFDLLPPYLRDRLARADALKSFELGQEEERCRYALERAAEGQTVALIGSGDAGIYAMGALVFELLDRGDGPGGVSAAAQRVEVVSIPGVSAMQTASARAGALLGHDFCAISLSDLLTPWADIERRIQAAADGDFVIAFYNPVSQKRRTQLARARDILLAARPETTPVLLGSRLGREDESVRRRTLASLSVDEVDMMTVVLVGSSQSRAVPSGDLRAGAAGADGRGAWLYTPRGYAAKRAPRSDAAKRAW